MTEPELRGQIIVLNGTPRAGKSSIARAIQVSFEGTWMNLGVDICMQMTPEKYRPGVGLRPGGERPDLEPIVVELYAGLYSAVAAMARAGLNVVVDVGHHDSYSRPLGILTASATRLSGLPVLFVGVRCPIEVIMERRNTGQPGREGAYLVGSAEDPVPAPIRLWQTEVHRPGRYDMEVDTSLMSPEECAAAISNRLIDGPQSTAFAELSRR